MRGKLTECIQLARTMASGGVLFTGEKYPKAAGDTGAGGFYKALCPRFPGPLSRTRAAAVKFKKPPNLKAAACRFGACVPLLFCPSSVTHSNLWADAIQ